MENFKKLTMYDENIETTTSDSTVPLLGLDNVRRSVTITLPLDIAETLKGLVDGCNGSSEDDEFSRQMNIVLKKLDKAISKHYA